jgi:hypothetical protein
MYLFSRLVTIAPGRMGSAQEFIADVTAHVREEAGFDVSVWSVLFGQPVGTIGWSMQVEDFAAYLDASAELNASAAYIDKINSAGDLFTGPAQDSLREAIHNAGEPPASFDYVSSTAAVIAEDYSKALTWSVEMADLAHATTGIATMVLRNVYGDFGGVQWLAGYPDSAAVAAANDAIRDSSEYVERLDAAEDLFVHGSGQQGLLRRML